MVDIKSIESQCRDAKEASVVLANLGSEAKNNALKAMAKALIDHTETILSENQKDLENGKRNGLSTQLLDRLTLTKERIEGISESILVVEKLKDPIGEILSGWVQPNGLKIEKVRVPLGVIGLIYEARPNVTADATSLALKSSNAVVLRGSSSAYQSNKAIAHTLKQAAKPFGVPENAIQLLEDTSREGVTAFVQMNDYLSVVIPRGGAGLIQSVLKTATVPSIETGIGNCHVYIDKDADLVKAGPLVINSKTHRPSVCNSAESLLVHADIAQEFLPGLLNDLVSYGVEIRGCEKTCLLFSQATPASEEDWAEEFLSLILSVKVVDTLDEALAHIRTYGSLHSEAIVSENVTSINRFVQEVDAAAVLVNASTRFTDGGEFGFGAEMGISTQKLHARGPMGLAELTTYKYIVRGEGQIR